MIMLKGVFTIMCQFFHITKKMEARNWDDLPKDCLAMVIQKVGVPASARNVPYVSKSWHKASREIYSDPISWKHIDFSGLEPSSYLFEYVVDRSGGSAVDFKFPDYCPVKDLVYVSERCPFLKYVKLPNGASDPGLDIIPKLVAQLKDLQLLELFTGLHFGEILREVSIHCNNLTGLIVHGYLFWNEAFAIIALLPKIRYLKFGKDSRVDWRKLEHVIVKCKELEEVDVSDCPDLKMSSAALLTKAPHLKIFKTQGTRAAGTPEKFCSSLLLPLCRRVEC